MYLQKHYLIRIKIISGNNYSYLHSYINMKMCNTSGIVSSKSSCLKYDKEQLIISQDRIIQQVFFFLRSLTLIHSVSGSNMINSRIMLLVKSSQQIVFNCDLIYSCFNGPGQCIMYTGS